MGLVRKDMTIEQNRVSVKRIALNRFVTDFKAGKFAGQKFGPALANHFGFHKQTDKALANEIARCGDDQKATMKIIKEKVKVS